MGDREDRNPGLARGGPQQRRNVERGSFEPGFEARRGKQVVQCRRELESCPRREEGLEVEYPHSFEARMLDRSNQGSQIEVSPGHPPLFDDPRQQNMLAALDGVGLDSRQRQEPRNGRCHPFPQRIRVGSDGFGWRIERSQHCDRKTMRRAGREDRYICSRPKPADSLPVLARPGQPVAPQLRRLRGELIRRDPTPRCFRFIDPRPEVLRPEFRECEQQVADVALRVYGQGRYSIERCLLEQGQAEARLAASRHPERHGMRGKVPGVVHEGRGRVLRNQPAEIECAESFDRSGRYRGRASLSSILHVWLSASLWRRARPAMFRGLTALRIVPRPIREGKTGAESVDRQLRHGRDVCPVWAPRPSPWSDPNKLRKSEGPGILIAPTTDPEFEDRTRWHWS